MPAEELVREFWTRWNEGDRAPDRLLFAEEIEIHSVMTQSAYSGHDGARR